MGEVNIQELFQHLQEDKLWIDSSYLGCNTIQNAIEMASQDTNLPLIVCNSVHDVVGISLNLLRLMSGGETLGKSVKWEQLAAMRCVPRFDDLGQFKQQERLADFRLNQNLFFHYSVDHESKRNYMMCDIMDHGIVLIKLSTFIDGELCIEDVRFFASFASALYGLFFRLHGNGLREVNDSIKLFKKLLYESNTLETYNGHSSQFLFQDALGFMLLGFEFQKNGEKNLIVPALVQQLFGDRQIGLTDDDVYIIMLALEDGDEDKLDIVNAEAKSLGLPVVHTTRFGHKVETSERYEMIRNSLRIARNFHNLSGMISLDSMFRFMIYDSMIKQDIHNKFAHPDAIALYVTDDQKGTEYESIVYTWLLNNCNTSKTAEKMYIHRNTLTNKLNKVFELLPERDWTNSNYQFKMLYSLYHDLKKRQCLREYHVLTDNCVHEVSSAFNPMQFAKPPIPPK